MPEPGDTAPEFDLETTGGRLRLADLLGKTKLVLAFYTADNTPLCSSEVSLFKNDLELIEQLGARVLAVSSDSLASHRAFAERLGGVPFPLGSDGALAVARLYGVADDESKRCRRAVFVISADGRVLHAEPWFQPGNAAQYEAIFRALGFDG